jgi:hypothetical protein
MFTKLLNQVKATVKHPTKHPVKLAVGGLGVFLIADYLMSAKGHSYAAKVVDSVLPSAHAHPRLAPPGGPAAAAAHAAATKGFYAGGPFGPGWGQGNMPYMYGGHYPESPAQVSAAHRAWAEMAGAYPEYWTQSQTPWQ